jgi:hypothetical protein
MFDGCDVPTAKAPKADAVPVERDRRAWVDREPEAAPIQLADREPRRSHPDDDATIDDLRCRRAGRHDDSGGAEQHQPEPSHARMLLEAGQRGVSYV